MVNNSLQMKMENIGLIEKEILLSIFYDDSYKILNDNITKCYNGVVCFTGNRPSSLPWQYNEDCEVCKEFKLRLEILIKYLIGYGYNKFITGMAMGFDLIAAEIVLKLKQSGENVELECALPCLNQTDNWKSDYIKRYKSVLDCADKITLTSSYNYFNGCYSVRNQYMVNNADIVLGCQLKPSSGTKATISFAKKNNKLILVII